MTTRTYRGRSLDELLPRVRAELGPDAIIVRQREGLTGGVGGFFQKRMVEIEAMAPNGGPAQPTAGAGSFSVTDDSPATPDFLEQLHAAQEAAQSFVPDPAFPRQPALEEPAALDDDAWSDWSQPPAAPAVGPVVTDAVPALPSPPPASPDSVAPRPAEGQTSWPAPLPAPAPSASVAWPEDAAPLRDALVAHGLDAGLADDVIADTVTHLVPLGGGGRLRKLVAAELARRIPVRPTAGAAGKVVAVVGPGGAGKTHCVGHLANAYALSGGLPVACVTLRPRDAGAELALLLAPAGVPLRVASDGPSAAAHVAALRAHALVLVDTPSVTPRSRGDLRALQSELKAIGADEVLLTLPATTSAAAAHDLVGATRRLGVSALTLTHADETDHLGPAVGVAMAADLPFAYIARAGDDDVLRAASSDDLAAALLNRSRRASMS